MNSLPVLQFNDVHFSYGKEMILDGLSFSVNKNTHVVLKGTSGRGKSTVLKLILGFLTPDKGSIQFNPDSENRAANIRSMTSWLPQDLNIGEGTVKDILSYPFQFAINHLKKPDEKTCLSVFNRLGLASTLYKKPFRSLSTGQRQRVGIALCYLLDKPLLLLDEPTAALDEAAKQNVADLLLGNPKRTIISTSHDPFWIQHATHVKELNG